MGKILYMDCNSGISGDMTVAALLDLGADRAVLERVLMSIPVKGFEIKISRVKKAGIDCMDFDVVLESECENHDHDMEYLYGSRDEDHHEHDEGHLHRKTGEDHHEHGHSHQTHVHRGLKEVLQILEKTDMTERAYQIARKIFMILAEAEAKAHGLPVEEVHFHEVGAIDSIVDVVAAAVCLDNLGITEVIIPVLCEGKGNIRCAHGVLPIPVPATANIMETYHLPVEMTGVTGELVTPTGAAIAAAVMTSDQLPGRIKIRKTGIGAGKRVYERSGILRVMLIEPLDTVEADMDGTSQEEKKEHGICDKIYKLETNLDDCTGEALGFVMEELFAAGARDVYYSAVYMKKNRPGYQLNVICDQEKIKVLEQIIFQNTTTIGIRKIPYERTTLKRRQEIVETKYGQAQVKVCMLDGMERYYPEYESAVKISREQNIPFQDIYREILMQATQKKQN